MVNDTALLFDVEDQVLARPARSVPAPAVSGSEEDLTPVAGVALWGPMLDRLNVVAEADRRGLRPIGPGGYTGGQCYRALTETLLAGGDFLSDRVLLADPATAALRGTNAFPSVSTLWRFLAGADLGRVMKAAAPQVPWRRRFALAQWSSNLHPHDPTADRGYPSGAKNGTQSTLDDHLGTRCRTGRRAPSMPVRTGRL